MQSIQEDELSAKKAVKEAGPGTDKQNIPALQKKVAEKMKQFLKKYSLLSPPKETGQQVLKDKRLKELWNSV